MLCFPDHLDKTVLANDIGKSFVRRIENIRRDTDAISLSPSDLSLVPPHRQATDQTLHSFDTLSERCVNDLIKNSAKKSCTLHPWPSTLVCDALDVVLPVITNVVNSSLSTGHFPNVWKEAIVNRLFKNGAKDTTTKIRVRLATFNLSPRLPKGAMFDQVYNHATVNELLPGLQSAYGDCACQDRQ